MHKNKDNFIEYNIIISFLNKKRYRKRKKFRYIVHLILYMDIKILNVHLEFNSTKNSRIPSSKHKYLQILESML